MVQPCESCLENESDPRITCKEEEEEAPAEEEEAEGE